MIFKYAILILALSATVFSIRHPHEHFVQMQICQTLSEIKYDKFNYGMKLRCEWSKFLDENTKLVNSGQSFRDSEYIYDIVFTPSAVPSEMQKYKIVKSGLFSNLRLSSVSFQNLGIVNVEDGAFNKFCCEKTLETLDLSKNFMVRLDAATLSNLGRLTRLNLASNRLALSERNFKNLRNLRYIDLSNNNLQFLPSHLFGGVTELELVNLSGNNLRSVDSCIFDQVQTSALARSLFPTRIDLSSNPIVCDCDVFYLAKHRNYKVSATCVSPAFYEGKRFSSLVREDPSKRCKYHKMESICSNNEQNELLLCLVISLSILAGLFLICCLTCCCKYMSASNKANNLEAALKRSKSDKIQYVALSNTDKQKLLA